MIGLDYRGVGNSTPVTCGISDADRSVLLQYPYPAPDGDISANVASAKRIAADCARNGGPDLPFMTTQNTARDLDRLRVALGDPKLSYVGTSYGTYLGLAYSTLFPDNIGHLILNSTAAPQSVQASMRLKGLGTEQAFDGFAQWAAGQDATYHLGTTAADVRALTLRTASALDSDPYTLPDGLVLSGNALRIAVQSFLEQPAWFPIVAGIIGIGASRQAPPGAGSTLPIVTTVPDNFLSDQDAVLCGDSSAPSSLAWYRQQVAIDRQLYPLTAGAPGNILPCAFWPYQPIEKPFVVNDHGARDILMLQNQADPSTAYAGALESRLALGHRAELVTVRAIGHGVPLTNPCVGVDVDNFLLHDTLATRDVTCGSA
jgi:pimeloyl-ACP methyl ester carboxylesterase